MTHHTQKGFTLVETLVAIFILTLSITGPLFIAQQSFTSAATARDRTTASFLAQEGIEYVRSVRDHNYLSQADWMRYLTSCFSGSCTVDSSVEEYPAIAACSGECPLIKQADTGFFGYERGEETRFKRTIAIESVQDATEVLVRVTVEWTQRGVSRSFVVEEYLFNWL